MDCRSHAEELHDYLDCEPVTGLNRETAHNIHSIAHVVKFHDWDWPWISDGDERVGKSNFDLNVLVESEPELDRLIRCAEYGRVLARVVWSFEQATETATRLIAGSALLFSEAALLGRESMKDTNLRMIRVMTTIGKRNLIFVWEFPDVYMLDPYLRDERFRTRAFVSSYKGDRGWVRLWARIRYPFPRPSGETVWWAPAFRARFRAIQTLSKEHEEFWQRFRELEDIAKNAVLEKSGQADPRREIVKNLRVELNLPIRKIAELTNSSFEYVRKVANDLKADGVDAGPRSVARRIARKDARN